jgi:hypothetical protein
VQACVVGHEESCDAARQRGVFFATNFAGTNANDRVCPTGYPSRSSHFAFTPTPKSQLALRCPGRALPGYGASTTKERAHAESDDAPSEPLCRTVPVRDGAAVEKVNAAFCVGMAYDDEFSCLYYPDIDTAACRGAELGYNVVYAFDQSGDVIDVATDESIALLYQGADGAFVIEWADGAEGRCTVVGDVATLCVQVAD